MLINLLLTVIEYLKASFRFDGPSFNGLTFIITWEVLILYYARIYLSFFFVLFVGLLVSYNYFVILIASLSCLDHVVIIIGVFCFLPVIKIMLK